MKSRTESTRKVPDRPHRTATWTAASSLLVIGALLIGSVAFALSVGTKSAIGDEMPSAPESSLPTAAQTKEALESGMTEEVTASLPTDPEAARSMPHRNVNRVEALELAEAVFEPELTNPGGVIEELEPEKILSDNAELVRASELPEGIGASGALASEHPNLPVLVETTMPLRAEDSEGSLEPVSLELEASEGELQPENPMVEVGIPHQLGEGISLPSAGVQILLAEGPDERTTTNADGQFAFYPEVAHNSDLIVAPTLQGVETTMDIRSADAPMQTAYELTLPPTSRLVPTKEGGAEVVAGDRTLLLIPPPSANDASGDPVQSELSVSGNTVTVAITPNISTDFPVLVDPTFITEAWHWTFSHDSLAAWHPSTTNGYAMEPWPQERWMYPDWYPGLDLSSVPHGNSTSGTHADWSYWVPRYEADMTAFKNPPTTWVYSFATEGIAFYEYGNASNYPALVWGTVDPAKGWHYSSVYYGGQGELTNWNRVYPPVVNANMQTSDKGADMDLVTYEAESPAKWRDSYLPTATITVVDEESPFFNRLVEPRHWLKSTPEPLEFQTKDEGLGVSGLSATFGGSVVGSATLACTGANASPCPRIVTSGASAAGEVHATLAINPTGLPTGMDNVSVSVADPVGHTATSVALVPVDHTAPELTLSGTLTEQGSLGTRRPSYVLRVNAKDGIPGAPQSGVKKVEVKVDGLPPRCPNRPNGNPTARPKIARSPASGPSTRPHTLRVLTKSR